MKKSVLLLGALGVGSILLAMDVGELQARSDKGFKERL